VAESLLPPELMREPDSLDHFHRTSLLSPHHIFFTSPPLFEHACSKMVSQPESVGQRRYRALASQNASSSLASPELAKHPGTAGKALITYGRSTRPLSLNASQFIRQDTYDIPSDSNDEREEAGALLQATARHDTVSSDSLLSDAESFGVPGSSHPTSSPRRLSKLDILEAASASTHRKPSSTAQGKKRTAKRVQKPKPKPKPTYDFELAGHPGRIAKSNPAVARNMGTRNGVSKEKPKAKAPARRLPVNELMLVASAPQYENLLEPLSSAPGVQTQDPITELSSEVRQGSVSSISSGSTRERRTAKTPLTSIRKRLKTPKYKHKVLKRKEIEQSSVWGGRGATKTQTGDGFEESELHIDYRIVTHRKRNRKTGNPLSYNVLQLASGPLPEVLFECSTDELQLEPSGGPHHITSQRRRDGQEERYVPPIEPPKQVRGRSTDELQSEPSGGEPHVLQTKLQPEQLRAASERSSQLARRQVSFSDREEFIMLQLSSISAPARPESDSEHDEEDEDLDNEEEDVEEEEIEEEAASETEYGRAESWRDDEAILSGEGFRRDTSPPKHHHTKHTARKGGQPSFIADSEGIFLEPTDHGVTLDFRKPAEPGSLPKRSIGRRRLIEVEEAIVDVPERLEIQVPRSDFATVDADIEAEIVNITSRKCWQCKTIPTKPLIHCRPTTSPQATLHPEEQHTSCA